MGRLPFLPLRADVETRAVLRAAVRAHRFLAELKDAARTIPNQCIVIDTLALCCSPNDMEQRKDGEGAMTITRGAGRLPTHHITIRVPWHDNGWNGTVCGRPLDNTSCLVLPRIGEGRNDENETRCAGQRFDELPEADIPPCIGERVSFMADFPVVRRIAHSHASYYPDTHGHFQPTRFVQPPYSAACVPFWRMLRQEVEGKDGQIGLVEQLRIE